MKRLSEAVKSKTGRQYGNPSTSVGKPFNDIMPADIFSRTALVCSAIVAVLGILVMAGWITGMHSLASLGSSSIPQAPASALAFILLGGTWFFYLHKPSRRIARLSVLTSAFFVLFVALLNLIRFFIGVNSIIEEFLISRILALDPGIYGANPMSPITAISFLLSCTAMILLLKHERRMGLSGGLASIVILVNLVVLLGYLYGTPLLYGGEIRPVSLPTGISFVFLSAGLIATAGPGHFPLRLLVGPSMRALLLRYFFLVILIFVLAHAVIYNLFSKLITNVALRTALAVLVAVVVNSAVVLQLSRVIGGAIEREETERKLVEKTLLESEEKFRSIVEQSGDGIVLTDEQGIIIEWNKAEEQIIGMKRSEVVGRPVWDVQFQLSPREKKTPEAYEKLKSNMLGLIITGRSQWLNRLWENDVQRPDGTRRSVQVLVFLVRTGKGWKIGSISRDITERKRAEERLQHRIDMEKLIASISTRFINISSDEIDSAINHTLKTIGGFAGVDRSYMFLFYDGGTKMDNTHEWCAEGTEPQIQNLKGLFVDDFTWLAKRLRKFENIYIPNVADLPPEAHTEAEHFQMQEIKSLLVVPMVSGTFLIGFLGFDSVVTKKTWLEEDVRLLKIVGEIFINALKRKQTEEAIKGYARELEESNRMKELFIDIMHHDLLNPLTVASGYIELLKEEQMYPKKKVYIDGVEKGLIRAHELIENATMFSKLRSLENIDSEAMDLKEVIGRVVENLAPLASGAGMIIENNITHAMPVSCNKMIEEVFANLISNAVKYAPKGKRIIIDSMDTGEFWRIRVIDFGEGIGDADKPRIFNRFLRIEKKGVKGSGLGLAIAERIVELHKGRIWVEDNPEGGAVFVVETPKRKFH